MASCAAPGPAQNTRYSALASVLMVALSGLRRVWNAAVAAAVASGSARSGSGRSMSASSAVSFSATVMPPPANPT